MTQSRKHSLLESLTNIAIGYIIAVLSQLAVFPLFNIHIPVHDNLMIGLFFTVVSLVRSYVLRRAFNWYQWNYGYTRFAVTSEDRALYAGRQYFNGRIDPHLYDYLTDKRIDTRPKSQ